MTEQQFKELLKKYQSGTATPSEVRDVEAFYNRYVDEALDEDLPILGNPDVRRKRLLEQVLRKYQDVGDSRRKSYAVVWSIAASIALFVAVGAAMYYSRPDLPEKKQPAVVDIAPGGDKAILQLSDNSTIVLDSIDQHTTLQQGSSVVTSTAGRLVYAGQGESAELIFNKIITPRGGQYHLILADGSKVWLNAASSLRFPVAFNGRERVVELTGEAYFEVAKDASKPFKVSLPTMQVEVLGTDFNVMAYDEEGSIKTTLIEGSVNIHVGPEGHQTVRLDPGQQAQLDGTGKVRVIAGREVVDQAVAWRFGTFRFEDTDMRTVMRQVSRWYDVDVEYEEGIEDLQFVGVVSRKDSISSVLRVMEHTDAIYFEITPGLVKVKAGQRPKRN